jgi:hypothetical protein
VEKKIIPTEFIGAACETLKINNDNVISCHFENGKPSQDWCNKIQR